MSADRALSDSRVDVDAWASGLRVRRGDLAAELSRDCAWLNQTWQDVHEVHKRLADCRPADHIATELRRALDAISAAEESLRMVQPAVLSEPA